MGLNIQIMNNIKRNTLEISLLGFLLEDPKHGYEIHKELSDLAGIGEVWRVKIGKLYSILKKLESGGFIQSKTSHEGNRPPKNTFNLTEKGKETFFEWIDTPINHGRDFRILFNEDLFYIESELFDGKKLINKQLAVCEIWKKRFTSESKEMKNNKTFLKLVKAYRCSQIDGYINWLEWCRDVIGEEV